MSRERNSKKDFLPCFIGVFARFRVNLLTLDLLPSLPMLGFVCRKDSTRRGDGRESKFLLARSLGRKKRFFLASAVFGSRLLVSKQNMPRQTWNGGPTLDA